MTAPVRTTGTRALTLAIGLAACARGEEKAQAAAESKAAAAPGPSTSLAQGTGFSGPEAVRYDPDQDVYFVSNFGGSDAGALDNDGFISRMRPDGTVENLRFIAGGGSGVTLHAPRGMTITGDTLWVADADAVRGFNKTTGAAVASVTFRGQKLGFLNDVAAAPDGTLHVTDTGTNRVYRIAGRTASVAIDDEALGGPNGITWDAANSRFLVVPYGGGHEIRAFAPGSRTLTSVATVSGAKMDGVELLGGGRTLIATQSDSTLRLVAPGQDTAIVHTAGQPADIGVDTKRSRVAVPYIALNRVDIFQLPGASGTR
jgi:hypothetical protein